MILSLNELQALATKAARGGGLPWGVADEAGRATRVLATWGLPGPAALADRLMELDSQPLAQITPHVSQNSFTAKGQPLCPILTGTALVDHADLLDRAQPLEIAITCQPLLLVPFLRDVAIKTGDSLVSNGMTIEPDAIEGSPETPLHLSFARPIGLPQRDPMSRADLSADTLSCLTRFAARTYAPESEQSRQSGAGDGT